MDELEGGWGGAIEFQESSGKTKSFSSEYPSPLSRVHGMCMRAHVCRDF